MMVIAMGKPLFIKRSKIKNINNNKKDTTIESIEVWASFWRANIHRFISDYLGLKYRAEFQPILMYFMDRQPNFIYAAARGIAKSTMALLYCIARCILYPGTTVIVVAPLRSQSLNFVQKIREFARDSKNLLKEIEGGMDGIKTSVNECGVVFENGSRIITKTMSDSARGERGTILLVDEFAQVKDKNTITSVFIPMLTAPRSPAYRDLSISDRKKLIEPTKQIYLSSIRSEMEWSWQYFLTYIDFIINHKQQ
jgi:hypothetical protein